MTKFEHLIGFAGWTLKLTVVTIPDRMDQFLGVPPLPRQPELAWMGIRMIRFFINRRIRSLKFLPT